MDMVNMFQSSQCAWWRLEDGKTLKSAMENILSHWVKSNFHLSLGGSFSSLQTYLWASIFCLKGSTFYLW